jgi:26S proteasome non-ATPase regulatory subunit 9
MVSENSPGSIAGIQTNDRILAFGSINCTNFKDLSQIGELVNNSKNHQIKIKLRRNENDLELILTPKQWAGQGLLGFKINAIPSA